MIHAYETYTLRADVDKRASAAYLAHSAVWPTYTVDGQRYAHVSGWSGDWAQARSLGYVAPPTSYAREIMQASAPKEEMHGLRPQWRAACHMAWTPGPMAVYSRGDCEVIGIDIRAAFLRAMAQPVPILASWRVVRMRPSDIQHANERGWGVVDATVVVPYATAPGLAIRDVLGNPVNPIGRFRGVFPLNVLAYNQRARGVFVEEVHGAQVCNVAPWLAPAAETFSLLHPFVRKHLYTRAYGLWGSIGGYRGTREPKRGYTYHRLQQSSLAWANEVLRVDSPASPMYRPDVSCCIASRNTVRMLTVMDTLEHRGYKLIASHVDCIWYKRLNSLDPVYCPDDFAAKHCGHGTFIRPGLYAVGEDCGRAGVPAGYSAEDIRGLPRGPLPGRTWRALDSYADPAVSDAPMLAPLAHERGVWSASGWLSEKSRDVSLADV